MCEKHTFVSKGTEISVTACLEYISHQTQHIAQTSNCWNYLYNDSCWNNPQSTDMCATGHFLVRQSLQLYIIQLSDSVRFLEARWTMDINPVANTSKNTTVQSWNWCCWCELACDVEVVWFNHLGIIKSKFLFDQHTQFWCKIFVWNWIRQGFYVLETKHSLF